MPDLSPARFIFRTPFSNLFEEDPYLVSCTKNFYFDFLCLIGFPVKRVRYIPSYWSFTYHIASLTVTYIYNSNQGGKDDCEYS